MIMKYILGVGGGTSSLPSFQYFPVFLSIHGFFCFILF